MRTFALTLALSLAAAGSAFAGSSLTLKNGDGAPNKFILDGASWRCEAGACTASGGKSQPALRACKRVVAKVGEVAAFSIDGRSFSEQELAECNAAAKR